LQDLDYEYDRYLNRPPGSPPFPAPSAVMALAVHAVSRQISGPVTLGASPATVALATQPVPSLNLPSGANTISFFGVAPHGANADHAAATTSTPRDYSFIVTDVVKQLQQAGQLTEEPNVTLVPTEAPSEGSAPSIGSVSLVSS
jgi:hypothetical protein